MSVEILLLRVAFGSIGSSAVIKSLNFSDKDKQKLNQRRHPNTDDHGADLIESLRGVPLHIKVSPLIVKELCQKY
jgi:hypothetical protein